jgi:hypothetical protein
VVAAWVATKGIETGGAMAWRGYLRNVFAGDIAYQAGTYANLNVAGACGGRSMKKKAAAGRSRGVAILRGRSEQRGACRGWQRR